MLADLDRLLIAVFCTADDLLPDRAGNARRRITDAEVVTLCVAQAMMGIASDERFLAVAAKRLSHLFPQRPKRPGYWKRRQRLADTFEALIGEFSRMSPGFDHDLLVVDSTPVECARSVETVRRSALADAADTAIAAATAATSGVSGCTARPIRLGRHPARDRADQPQVVRVKMRAEPYSPERLYAEASC